MPEKESAGAGETSNANYYYVDVVFCVLLCCRFLYTILSLRGTTYETYAFEHFTCARSIFLFLSFFLSCGCRLTLHHRRGCCRRHRRLLPRRYMNTWTQSISFCLQGRRTRTGTTSRRLPAVLHMQLTRIMYSSCNVTAYSVYVVRWLNVVYHPTSSKQIFHLTFIWFIGHTAQHRRHSTQHSAAKIVNLFLQF